MSSHDQESSCASVGTAKAQSKECANLSCANAGTLHCGACGLVMYCSQACQKKHWRRKPDGHKAECKLHVAAKKKTASIGPARASSSGGNRDDSSGGGGRIAQPLVIAVGCRVRIEGIQSKPELNGTKGVVTQAVAAIKKVRWHVQLDDTGAVVSLSESCLVPIAAAPKDAGARVVVDTSASKECYVCLGADATVVPLGCACRGAAGSAHVACIAEAAAHAFAENNLSWSVCPLCKQWYTGEMQLELAEERMCRVKHLPETDMEAQFALGRALEQNGQYDKAIVIFRKMLSLLQEMNGSDHPATINTAEQLALSLGRKAQNIPFGDFTAECTEAIKLHKNNLRVRRRICGLTHRSTLGCMSNLASALAADRNTPVDQIEESIKLFRITLKKMQLVLPENDFYVQSTMGSFAAKLRTHAFAFPVKRAMELLGEAKDLLQKVVAIQERLLGPEHPETKNNQNNLMMVKWHCESYLKK